MQDEKRGFEFTGNYINGIADGYGTVKGNDY